MLSIRTRRMNKVSCLCVCLCENIIFQPGFDFADRWRRIAAIDASFSFEIGADR